MKRTIRTISWLWIITLFLSPLIGLFSILMLSCIELGTSVDWDASFTGKKLKKSN